MTFADQSHHKRHRASAIAVSSHVLLLNHGARLLLLAAGGFMIVRIALALLQLS
jgi:hypothetical protein